MYNAAKAHDIEKVKELQKQIMAISTTIYTVGKWGSSYLKGVKCACSLLGIISDDFLPLPYKKFEAGERAKIAAALKAIGAEVK